MYVAGCWSTGVVSGLLATRRQILLVVDFEEGTRSGWLDRYATLAALVYCSVLPLFPGFAAIGLGLGLSFLATQVAAFIGVEEKVAGLACGMVETAREGSFHGPRDA